ncbi:UNVERIFIED_CONTAM: hypothetical protein Slati_4262000 [Sesamum latifolium]|uniref:Reverse transcriptase zinc-binding domain-containing protein n=1 Tax=Sesamum latifolium TaxID=2727402 RepID=A0AAW2TC55_9LAMI
MDADCILGINLGPSGVWDKLVWHYEEKGIFTVKSAYKLAIELKTEGSCSQSGSYWNFIWKSKALPKVVLFAWKLVCEALPTTENLKKRGIPISDSCFCSIDMGGFGFVVGELRFTSASVEDWFRAVHGELDQSEWYLFLNICWALWWARNQRMFEGREVEAPEVGEAGPAS